MPHGSKKWLLTDERRTHGVGQKSIKSICSPANDKKVCLKRFNHIARLNGCPRITGKALTKFGGWHIEIDAQIYLCSNMVLGSLAPK
jgi:hypothetical protein